MRTRRSCCRVFLAPPRLLRRSANLLHVLLSSGFRILNGPRDHQEVRCRLSVDSTLAVLSPVTAGR